MKKPGMHFSIGFLVCLLLMMSMAALVGCNQDSGGSGATTVIDGKVTGCNFQGAAVELFDASGARAGMAPAAVMSDGSFSLPLSGVSKSDYYLLKVSLGDKSLRCVVTGFRSGKRYSGQDTYVSPSTEAAVLLSSLENKLNLKAYGHFLKSMNNGVYDSTDIHAGLYPFRKVIGDVTASVNGYLSGISPLPDENAVLAMVRSKNHVLTAVSSAKASANKAQKAAQAQSSASDAPESDYVQTALVSNDNDLVYLSYDADNSSLTDSTPITVDSSTDNDGGFSWKTYRINLGSNVLSSLFVETPPLSGQTRGTVSTFDTATGNIDASSSNIGALVDMDGSGLSPDGTNTNAVFKINFKSPVQASKTSIKFYLVNSKGNKTLYDTLSMNGAQVYSSKSLTLTDQGNQDMIVQADFVNEKLTLKPLLFSIADVIDKTRYQNTSPMVAMRTMSQTRINPDSPDMLNNLPNTNDNEIQPVVCGNTHTHYILDFDRLLGKGVVPAWDATAYGKAPPGDGKGRIPLVFVHGWQSDSGTQLRSAARLALWVNSPVYYLHKFLSYYLYSASLQNKYHIYFMRWPTYKHLNFSADIFSRMLREIKTSSPSSDLGIGMSDPKVGVVLMTHSTGGLIGRSALETYDAMSDGSDRHAFLRAAVLLASPNHGTPEALNTIPNKWVKDVSNQSTSDLEWNSFDGNAAMSNKYVGTYDYRKDRSTSRWVSTIQNVKDFDDTYLSGLADPETPTYNPWLLWLNKAFMERSDSLNRKYILYTGWTRTSSESGNYVNNPLVMAFAKYDINSYGYFNDSVLPVSSNLFAGAKSDTYFYLSTSTPVPAQSAYPNSLMYFMDNIPIITVGKAADHPLGMNFRIFWDYDHSETLAGALSSVSQADVDAYISQPDVLGANPTTDFYKESSRKEYIRGAKIYVNGVDPGPVTQTLNPLKYEPFFLILEKDLLGIANGVN